VEPRVVVRDALARVDARSAHAWHLAPPYVRHHQLTSPHALRVQPARALDPGVFLHRVLLVRPARAQVVGVGLRAEEQVHGPRSFLGRLVVVSERRASARRCGLLESVHGGDLVRGVAQVGEILAHEPVLVVTEDTGDRGGDIEEVAFEGEDEGGVCG